MLKKFYIYNLLRGNKIMRMITRGHDVTLINKNITTIYENINSVIYI